MSSAIKQILVKSIHSKTTHILKRRGKHGFYGDGVFTMCNKHLRTETFTPETVGRKCKFCFFKPKITWVKRSNT